MNRTPSVECPTCDGKGQVDLPEYLAETLALMGKEYVTAETLCGRSSDMLKPTAFSNRLRRLQELGFVTRIRKAKYWLYKKSPKPAAK